jgi:hypothetical protein
MNTFFDRLGDDIAQRWRACGNTAASFPAIAREALESHDLPSRLGHVELVRGALRASSWPAQFGSPFGQPPLNVYIGPGFFIEVLTWVESTTAVHQHNFCGAFQVLTGSSLHSAYRFEERERVGNRLLIGDTSFEGSEHLTKGSVREIHSGPDLIHALFHLDHPSATIVVRTVDDGTGPQYLYAKPHVAYDPFWAPEPYATQVRLLNMLAAIKDPGLPDALAEVIEGSDIWCAYRFLEVANRHAHDALDGLVEVARKRHGGLVEAMRPSLDEARRQANIVLRRDRIRETEHRFFLALLLNLPDRGSIFDAVRARFPGEEPAQWIVGQVRSLSGEDRIGLSFDALSLLVLEGLLEGREEPAIQGELETRYGQGAVRAQQDQLTQLFAQMREAVLLQPLFA